MRAVDLTGQTFGRLTVLRLTGSVKGHRMWLCRCACGVEKAIQAGNLRSGASQSCDCLRLERLRERVLKHGHSIGAETQAYRAWGGMKTRCYNPRARYAKWGGRGIKVCDRWRDSFENFLADMGEPPSPEHSIDRWPNNDGDYEPGNCRWATAKEQAANTRLTLPSTVKPQSSHISP